MNVKTLAFKPLGTPKITSGRKGNVRVVTPHGLMCTEMDTFVIRFLAKLSSCEKYVYAAILTVSLMNKGLTQTSIDHFYNIFGMHCL